MTPEKEQKKGGSRLAGPAAAEGGKRPRKKLTPRQKAARAAYITVTVLAAIVVAVLFARKIQSRVAGKSGKGAGHFPLPVFLCAWPACFRKQRNRDLHPALPVAVLLILARVVFPLVLAHARAGWLCLV